MPNLTVYVENDVYISFLKKTDKKRKEIRDKVVDLIKFEIGIKNNEKEVKE